MKTVKVSGHEGLRKDLNTQAVINDDVTAYELAIALKTKRLAEINRLNDLESKVEKLESLLTKLLTEGKE